MFSRHNFIFFCSQFKIANDYYTRYSNVRTAFWRWSISKRHTCKIQVVFFKPQKKNTTKRVLSLILYPVNWICKFTTLHKNCLMHCGKTLMLLRKFKNTTQQQLAKRLATTQQYISELEKQNHFNSAKLEKILKALNSSKEEWEQLRRFGPPSENW